MSKLTNLWDRFAVFQSRHSLWIVAIGLLCAAASVPLVAKLKLNSDWTALLPRDRPSVRDLEMAKKRVGGMSTLTVALTSRNTQALQRFAKDLVPRVKRLKPIGVRAVDWNVGAYENFVRAHRHLYADLEDLEKIRDALKERSDYERLRRNPLYIDLGDDEPQSLQEMVSELERKERTLDTKLRRYPGGFYLHPKGDFLVFFVRTDIGGGDGRKVNRLLNAIRSETKALNPASYAPDLKVDFGGDLIGAREEHEAIAQELVIATVLTTVLVLVAIYGLFRRFRAIPQLGLSIAVSCLMTFAFTELTIGYLNASTAFLGSIVLGNGLNPMVIWLARYFEERRRGQDVQGAVIHTHRGVWYSTFTASMAAAVAYGCLWFTDFRGFRDFGIIGSCGMVLAWAATILFLPAIAVASEHLRPLVSGRRKFKQGAYGVQIWRVIERHTSAILWGSIGFGAITFTAVIIALLSDPIEYNFRNLRSVREGSTRARKINKRTSDIVGGSLSGGALAILTPSHDESLRLKQQLVVRREKQNAPYGAVRVVDDFLPADQSKKIPLLREIATLLVEARPHVDDKERALIDRHMPPAQLNLLKLGDLSSEVVRPFSERDGTVGRINLVEQKEGESIWDGQYFIRWSDALRQLRLSDGSRPPLAGRAPVFADMIQVIRADGPKVMALSFFVTCLLVFLTFRNAYHRALTIGALVLSVIWMGGTMALLRVKLNFLNFVSFPIMFGIGIDYAVNVVRRFSEESERSETDALSSMRASIEETGGAVILCSLTTIIGYMSLYTSQNQALNSFGLAMTISEITSVTAATLTIPAFILWRRARRSTYHRATEPPPRPL